jgi:hypothetical protein
VRESEIATWFDWVFFAPQLLTVLSLGLDAAASRFSPIARQNVLVSFLFPLLVLFSFVDRVIFLDVTG